jgi:hypothetical protein
VKSASAQSRCLHFSPYLIRHRPTPLFNGPSPKSSHNRIAHPLAGVATADAHQRAPPARICAYRVAGIGPVAQAICS